MIINKQKNNSLFYTRVQLYLLQISCYLFLLFMLHKHRIRVNNTNFLLSTHKIKLTEWHQIFIAFLF